MRAVLPFAVFVLAAASLLPAQANDYSGLRVYEGANTANGAPTPLVCGTAFTCTPAVFSVTPVVALSFVITGELNGFYVLAASVDTANPVCSPLGVPGLVNQLVLNPGSIVSIAVGLTSMGDNGRCNGGLAILGPLFAIPAGLPPGAIAFQAVTSTPLSAGGSGLAFSNPVVVNY